MRRVLVTFIVNVFSSILIFVAKGSYLDALLLIIYVTFETITSVIDIHDIDGNLQRINICGQFCDAADEADFKY